MESHRYIARNNAIIATMDGTWDKNKCTCCNKLVSEEGLMSNVKTYKCWLDCGECVIVANV